MCHANHTFRDGGEEELYPEIPLIYGTLPKNLPKNDKFEDSSY